MDDREQRIREHERAFRRAGMPNLIEGTTAAEDVWTRAAPFLALVVLVEVLNALNEDFSALGNVLALVGGVVLVALGFAGLNVVRGRRALALPRRLGTPELVGFVLAPALLPLVFGGQWRSALVTVAVNALLLAGSYLVVAFGIVSIARWALTRFGDQLAASGVLLTRALPLLLFFGLVIFFTTETWQIWTAPPLPHLVTALALLALLALAFLMLRLPGSTAELVRDTDVGAHPLTRAQRVNVAFVILTSQALQVVLVSAAVWLFFVVFGSLLVPQTVRMDWLGDAGQALWTMSLLGSPLVVTTALVRVATGMAAVSGLYYAVASAIDATYRDGFVDELSRQMHETFARRAEYLGLRRTP